MLANSETKSRLSERNLVSSFGQTVAVAFAAILLLSSALSPAFADSFFVSTASNGKAVNSNDGGETWTISDHNHQSMFAVGFAEGTWVALGQEGGTGQALRSDDGGQTWNVAITPPSGAMLGVTFANGRFVAVGFGGAAAYSDDLGQTWVSTLHSNGNMRGVTFGNGRFVAVGLGGVASYSLDGINWIASDHNNGQMTSVAFGNGTFVAVDGGGGSPTGDHVSFSTDGGQTWSNNIVEPPGNLRSVTFANGRFVGVGFGKYRYSDDNGATWIDGAFDDGGIPSSTNSVTHGNGRFVAIGDSTGAYSFDGITWFRSAPHNNANFQPTSNALAHGETIDNEAPVANAGPDSAVRAGDTVTLDGSGSFDDNTATVDLDYSWSFSLPLPAGSLATLVDANTASPSFTADVLGTYIVELVVTDEGALPSAADQVEISSDNLAPTAAAGDDQLVIIGTPVVLDGSDSSDPDTDPLTFDWIISDAPLGSAAVVTDDDMETASMTPDLEGVYVVTLTVSDFLGEGAPDTVEITATTAESFAEDRIMCAADIVSSLGPSQVTTKGNQKALLNFLRQAVSAIQKGNTATAIDKLEKSIARADGCEATGSPDGNGPGRDWVTDCDAQSAILICLSDALDALTP